MSVPNLLAHLFTSSWARRRAFPPAALADIEADIRNAEALRDGQIRVAIDSALPITNLLRGRGVRDRAVDVFSRLRVWDTARNNGVLIYLCLASRQVEIVADRGIAGQAGPEAWAAVCREMETLLRAGNMPGGVRAGVAAVSRILARHQGPDALTNDLLDLPKLL